MEHSIEEDSALQVVAEEDSALQAVEEKKEQDGEEGPKVQLRAQTLTTDYDPRVYELLGLGVRPLSLAVVITNIEKDISALKVSLYTLADKVEQLSLSTS